MTSRIRQIATLTGLALLVTLPALAEVRVTLGPHVEAIRQAQAAERTMARITADGFDIGTAIDRGYPRGAVLQLETTAITASRIEHLGARPTDDQIRTAGLEVMKTHRTEQRRPVVAVFTRPILLEQARGAPTPATCADIQNCRAVADKVCGWLGRKARGEEHLQGEACLVRCRPRIVARVECDP